MQNDLVRQSLAELIGTFVLVFVGSAAVIVAPLFGVVVPALAHGLILVGLIFTYGHISGAQFNPAVTLALLVGGKQDVTKSAIFMVVQFIGGIIAAVVLVAVVSPSDPAVVATLGDAGYNFGQTKGFLTDNSVWSAAVIEAILTFFLVSAVYQAAVYGRAGNLAGVAIGFTLAASILAGGVPTGASLNPARTLGPALVAGDTAYLIPYFIGLFAGGAIGGLVHAYVLPSPAEKNS